MDGPLLGLVGDSDVVCALDHLSPQHGVDGAPRDLVLLHHGRVSRGSRLPPSVAACAASLLIATCCIGRCVFSYLGSYFSNLDIEYYPNTRRFGVRNDGLGLCQRTGALLGVFAWAGLGMALCSHRWSETENLAVVDPLNTEPTAVHFASRNLGMVRKASWGLVRYCMEMPIAALDDSYGSVCLTYNEEVGFLCSFP